MKGNSMRLLIRNQFDAATLTAAPATVTALSNMLNTLRSRIVRWTDITGECLVSAEMPAAYVIDGFAVTNTNLTASGYCGLRLYDGADNLLHDTGQVKIGGGLPAWATGNGFVWGVDRLGVFMDKGVSPTASAFFTPVGAERAELYFYDPDNPAGYIQFGYAVMGASIQPKKTFSFGWSVSELNNLEYVETEGGSRIATNLPRIRRVLSVPHNFLADYERSDIAAQRRLYPDSPVFVALFPAGSTLQRVNFSMLSVMEQETYTQANKLGFESGLTFIEV